MNTCPVLLAGPRKPCRGGQEVGCVPQSVARKDKLVSASHCLHRGRKVKKLALELDRLSLQFISSVNLIMLFNSLSLLPEIRLPPQSR